MISVKTVKTLWAEDELKQNTHILEDETSCVVVDAGCSLEQVKSCTKKPIKAVFITHGHYDHIKYIQQYDKLGVPIYAHKTITQMLASPTNNVSNIFDKPTVYKVYNLKTVDDGDIIKTAGFVVKCIYTPGHSKDGLCFMCDDLLLSGDNLFSVAVGRTDLPTASVEELIQSLTKINNLNFDKMYTGHGRESNKKEQDKNIPMWISILKMQHQLEQK